MDFKISQKDKVLIGKLEVVALNKEMKLKIHTKIMIFSNDKEI